MNDARHYSRLVRIAATTREGGADPRSGRDDDDDALMMMMGAFVAAVAQLPDRSFRRVFWRGLAVAVGLLLALAIVSSLGLGWLAPANLTGVDVLLSTLGALAGLFLGWLLFPALTASVIALMVEPIARAVEAKHYPHPPRSEDPPSQLHSP